jgi:flagellar hook-associated protein 3 FlgL
MSVPPLSKSIGWTRGISEGRNMMLDLQRQLATGQKSTTFGGLGPDRSLSLAMRSRISSIQAYQSSIQMVDLRLKVMVQALDRFTEIGRETRSGAMSPSYELSDGNRTGMQLRAEASLDEALSLMRSDVAGRHLFAGRAVETNPVGTTKAILYGEGNRDGFQQVMHERKMADLGADNLGRLDLDSAQPDELTLSKIPVDLPFGFTINSFTSTTAGTVTTTTAGNPPVIDTATISYATDMPQPDDKVRVRLGMPDGTETVVELTAVPDGEGMVDVLDDDGNVVGTAPAKGKFEIVENDPDATIANLRAALELSIEREAVTGLATASSYVAADQFFNYDDDRPLQRIDGDPDFYSATGFRDGTDDTVQWYVGDTAPGNPRETVVARVDDQMQVAYGARANEDGLRWTIQNLAVLAAETFSKSVDTDQARHEALMSRTIKNMSSGDQRPTPQSIHAQIASNQHTIGKASERHKALNAVALDLVSHVEQADPHEVAVKLLQLETRLQASYQTTAMLSKMSLVYHM